MKTGLIYSYCVRHRNGWGTGFGPSPDTCATCGRALPKVPKDKMATGYASIEPEPVEMICGAPPLKRGESYERSRAICYPCSAERLRADMIRTGEAALYLQYNGPGQMHKGRASYPLGGPHQGEVTDWTGTLRFPANVSVGRHNIARWRFDAWFVGPDKFVWACRLHRRHATSALQAHEEKR